MTGRLVLNENTLTIQYSNPPILRSSKLFSNENLIFPYETFSNEKKSFQMKIF